MIFARLAFGTLITAALLGTTACKSTYYGTQSMLGNEKRDIFVDRVEDGRDAQHDAKEQMTTALERFNEVVDVDGGDLEKKYKKLDKEYKKCTKAAKEVNDRIAAIDGVAKDLFKEWEKELKQYSSDELRRQSKAQLNETKQEYKKLITSMRAAAESMDPVLATFGDQVLYLKHNLNSRAIASIQGEAKKVESDVSNLISEMEKSIAEADAFIAKMDAK